MKYLSSAGQCLEGGKNMKKKKPISQTIRNVSTEQTSVTLNSQCKRAQKAPFP